MIPDRTKWQSAVFSFEFHGATQIGVGTIHRCPALFQVQPRFDLRIWPEVSQRDLNLLFRSPHVWHAVETACTSAEDVEARLRATVGLWEGWWASFGLHPRANTIVELLRHALAVRLAATTDALLLARTWHELDVAERRRLDGDTGLMEFLWNRVVDQMDAPGLAGVIIDCTGELAPARDFWAAALDCKVQDGDENHEGQYAVLSGNRGLALEIQARQSSPGVHLDLRARTDDIEAEIERLVTLGASVVRRHARGWIVMQAPTGHRFCVIPAQRELGAET